MKKVLCIRDVVMHGDYSEGVVAFVKGNTYDILGEGDMWYNVLNQQNKHHTISKSGDKWFDTYFELLESNINRLYKKYYETCEEIKKLENKKLKIKEMIEKNK